MSVIPESEFLSNSSRGETGGARILVPTDFGPRALVAYRRACDLARAMQSTVCLVHVIECETVSNEATGLDALGLLHTVISDPPPNSPLAGFSRRVRFAEAERRLKIWSQAAWADEVEVITSVITGRLEDSVTRHALELNTQLIVLPAPAVGWRRLFSRRNASQRIVDRAHCPVMFVQHPKKLAASAELLPPDWEFEAAPASP